MTVDPWATGHSVGESLDPGKWPEVQPTRPLPEENEATLIAMWPAEAAKVVRDWALRAGNAAAAAAVDKIRDWLGHPEIVMRLAATWNPDAARFISDAANGIKSAKIDLKAYWEGPAFDSFNAYADDVLKIIGETHKVMADMSNHLMEMRKKIADTYKTAITFIGDCATTILKEAGKIGQEIKNLWGAVCSAIFNALAGFFDAYTKLMTEAVGTMDEYSRRGLQLQQRAAALRLPEPMPKSVGEPGNWRVHPAAGS